MSVCFTSVEEKLEQNLVRKPLLLTLMTTPVAVTFLPRLASSGTNILASSGTAWWVLDCLKQVREALRRRVCCSAIIVIQISINSFTFTGGLLPHQFSLDHPSSWHHLWDFKSRTREQPGLERSRAV